MAEPPTAPARRSGGRLEALAQVTLGLSQELDPDRLLQQITDALATLTGAHNVVLWEVDRAAGLLVRRAWTADSSIGAMELPTSLTMEQGGTGWIARHREPLVVEDIAIAARIMAAQWALSRDLVAFAGVPVAAGDDLLGVLTLNLKRGRLPQGEDRTLLPSFAAQAAVALRNARLFAENKRLYEEARQRLRELQDTQGQLLQAGKLSAVGQLVSGVAHELNNPLSVVIGYGQLLLSRGVPEEARRPIELIVAQGARMAKIIQSLLLFSRQRKPERRALDLRDVIRQILSLRETQLGLSGIRVETELGEDVPPAEGDSHQLQQVFLNLILNAEQAVLAAAWGRELATASASRPARGVRRADLGGGAGDRQWPRHPAAVLLQFSSRSSRPREWGGHWAGAERLVRHHRAARGRLGGGGPGRTVFISPRPRRRWPGWISARRRRHRASPGGRRALRSWWTTSRRWWSL
jgi:signal transduction histidine kinase